MSEGGPLDGTFDVSVTAIGAKGDGVAAGPDGAIYLPYTVPGDRVRLRIGAAETPEMVERLVDGPDRRLPPCPHFGACGGCALQQLEATAYESWKRTLVVEALARRGLDPPVAPLFGVAPGTRRRVRLSVRMTENAAIVGFRERRGHRTVDVDECPVVDPRIAGIIAPLRQVAIDIVPHRSNAEFVVTALDSGLDILVQASKEPVLQVREHLVRFAESYDLARISWMTPRGEAEPVAARRPAGVRFGPVAVTLPPVSFLQPTEAGESALRAVIHEALDGTRRIADLFSGCGALGLPLAAAGASLFAADADGAALSALQDAARAAGFGERVSVERRHLGRRPLAGDELALFDAVVLDPPRAGALDQARVLVESEIPVIAYASCNPGTFARDARTLVDGGYVLERVTPVDQFLWSPHVELVGVFHR